MLTLERLFMTSGVDDAVAECPELASFINTCVQRHTQGDWGDVDDHDTEVNNESLTSGARILSSYLIPDTLGVDETSLWIISDAAADEDSPKNRDTTTILFPSEY